MPNPNANLYVLALFADRGFDACLKDLQVFTIKMFQKYLKYEGCPLENVHFLI
jgi:hypothetical protein